MAKSVQVTDPVAVVERNKHCSTSVYVLPSDRHFFQLPYTKPEDREAMRVVGPNFVLATKSGIGMTYKTHGVGSKEFWDWIFRYVRAGEWALNAKAVAHLLPDELAAQSRRFARTTPARRRQMNRPKTPPASPKGRTKKK